MEAKPKFFADQNEFRAWLRKNHNTQKELWVGYYKKATGLPSMTWSESVDQALCYGWIDGLRKSIDDKRYMIRFTPRKPKSIWSTVNIKKIGELKKKKLMRAAGLAAWERREEHRSAIYSYEQAVVGFKKEYESLFRNEKSAWKNFQKMPPGYRKLVVRWIMSAKRTETQLRRLNLVIKHSALGEKLPQYDWKKSEER